MKQLAIILILALLSASAYCGLVEKHGKLSVNGSGLVDELGKPIVRKSVGSRFWQASLSVVYYNNRHRSNS